jgi:IS30 family transposase
MTHKHLTMNEISMIETCYHQNVATTKIIRLMQRATQTIYNVINYLKEVHTAFEYSERRYKQNKKRCSRHAIALPDDQKKLH